MKNFKILNKEILNLNFSQKKLNIISRNSHIIPQLLNKKIEIYNGKTFKSLIITDNFLINKKNKLGDFVLTREHCKHSRPKKKNKIRIKK